MEDVLHTCVSVHTNMHASVQVLTCSHTPEVLLAYCPKGSTVSQGRMSKERQADLQPQDCSDTVGGREGEEGFGLSKYVREQVESNHPHRQHNSFFI